MMTIAEAREKYGNALVERALQRKVLSTRYGWRVDYDPELDGDYERDRDPHESPRNYWPRPPKSGGGRWWCRCRLGRSGRMCSHVLAVHIVPASSPPKPAPTVCRAVKVGFQACECDACSSWRLRVDEGRRLAPRALIEPPAARPAPAPTPAPLVDLGLVRFRQMDLNFEED